MNTYTYTHKHKHAYTYTFTDTHTHVCIHIHACILAHTRIDTVSAWRVIDLHYQVFLQTSENDLPKIAACHWVISKGCC